jgi:hypothetical protein
MKMAGVLAVQAKKDSRLAQTRRQAKEPQSISGQTAPHAGLLALQRTAGNRAVARLLQAAESAGASGPVIGGRQVGGPGGPHSSVDLRGQSLAPAIRTEMEARFGRDFGRVRVHTGEVATASALAEGARAYTMGRDIVFGEGRYAPETREGKRLLAHELAHVVQQTRPAGRHASPAAAEGEAQQAAGQDVAGGRPAIKAVASGIQRDDLTEEDRRRLMGSSRCPSGNCHQSQQRPAPIRFPDPQATGTGTETGGPFGPLNLDPAVIKQWIEAQSPSPQAKPVEAQIEKPPVPPRQISPATLPAGQKAPPAIAHLPAQRKGIQVVEFFVPETRFASPLGAWGSNRVLSQAEPVAQYPGEIDRPDPTAGYNFDTYLLNIQTGQKIPAQHLGGTRFRVLMGTPECPGCHFGRGLEVDLHGESFAVVMAQGLMDAAALSDMASGFSALGRTRPPLSGAARLGAKADEYENFVRYLQEEEGAVGRPQAAGEPVSMQPHGGASEARRTLGVSGDQQSAHGVPRSVGKHLAGYDPDAALTTLQQQALHTELDQPWKDAFQDMRRQGRTTASAQKIYDTVANSIDRSSQLAPGMKETLKLRLQDEMFVEYSLQPGQQMTLPYPNIRPRP